MTQFYVYVHIDPRTSFPRYIGVGQGQRAWMMRNSGSGPRYGHRTKEHYAWFKELETLGYTLDEIVIIKHKNLAKQQAKELESEMISYCSKYYGNLFNIHQGKDSMLDKELLIKVQELKSQGLRPFEIRDTLNIGHTMAWRYSNAC